VIQHNIYLSGHTVSKEYFHLSLGGTCSYILQFVRHMLIIFVHLFTVKYHRPLLHW